MTWGIPLGTASSAYGQQDDAPDHIADRSLSGGYPVQRVQARVPMHVPLRTLEEAAQDMPALRRKVSFHFESVSLEEALRLIAEKADLKLAYSSEKVRVGKSVTLSVQHVPVHRAFHAVLRGTQLVIKVGPGKQLVLVTEKQLMLDNSGNRMFPLLRKISAAPLRGLWQEKPLRAMITGTVTDASTGEALPGVNVVVKGSMEATGSPIGTSTDVNGTYEIEVPAEFDTLSFSFVGYQAQEVAINGRTEISVALSPDVEMLEDVVVVGYGVQQRSDLTGSVSSIHPRDFNEGANTSVEQLIQGKVAGVQISQTSGEPGGGMSIQIRGVGSINAGTDPLYVIDGVPIDNTNMLSAGGEAQLSDNQNPRNPLNTINTNDIESIEILKDASATAIYGSRAANGVVLITTKKGATGRVQVNFSSKVGSQLVSQKMDLLSAVEYANVMNGLALDRGEDPVFTQEDINALGVGTDWQDQIFRRGKTFENNLSLSGGNESSTYYLSVNQFSQDGIVESSGLDSYSFRTNLNTDITNRLETGFNVTASLVDNNNIAEGVNINEQGGPIYTSLLFDPTLSVYDEDGNFLRSPHLTMNNPLAVVEGISTANRVTRFLGNGYARYRLFDQLQMNLNIGYDRQHDERDIYNSTLTIHGEANNGIANIAVLDRSSILLEYTAQYDRDINFNNYVQVLAGATYQDFNYEAFSGQMSNFPTDDIKTYNLSLGDISSADLNSSRERYKLLSYLGRVNYRLLNRYLLTASIRADGSSRFGENNRYGVFPSLALAWNLDQENFIPEYFNELKLRASWGVTGNQEIGNYNTQLSFIAGPDAVLGGQRVGSLIPSRVENPDLKWERTEQYNIGLDASIFDARLSATMEYFVKRTNDMLIEEPLPPSSGFASRLANLDEATIENRGFELGINSINVSSTDFTWRTNATVSVIRNTVKDLGSITNILVGNLQNVGSYAIIREGDPIASYYGHKITGIFQEEDDIANSAQPNAKPGYPIVQDTNGDGAITDADKVILGDPHPDFVFGIQNRLSYKRFELELFVDAKQGYELLNMNLIETLYPHNFRRNRFAEPYLNRWTPTNTDTRWPSGTFPSEYSGGKVNSLTVEDASYIRLKTVTLRYRIPQTWARNATVSVTGQNLFTITDYRGFNPEANAFGRGIGRVDFNTYPLARTILFGITLGF